MIDWKEHSDCPTWDGFVVGAHEKCEADRALMIAEGERLQECYESHKEANLASLRLATELKAENALLTRRVKGFELLVEGHKVTEAKLREEKDWLETIIQDGEAVSKQIQAENARLKTELVNSTALLNEFRNKATKIGTKAAGLEAENERLREQVDGLQAIINLLEMSEGSRSLTDEEAKSYAETRRRLFKGDKP